MSGKLCSNNKEMWRTSRKATQRQKGNTRREEKKKKDYKFNDSRGKREGQKRREKSVKDRN